MPKDRDKVTQTTLRLPTELYRQARIIAIERGTTFRDLVQTLLENEIARSKGRRALASEKQRAD